MVTPEQVLSFARADRERFERVLLDLDAVTDPQALARMRVMGVDADAVLARFAAKVEAAAEKRPHPTLGAILRELAGARQVVTEIRARLERRALVS